MSLWSRIANMFRADRLSRGIDEELASHIDAAIEQGRDPVEARRAFGSALQRRGRLRHEGQRRRQSAPAPQPTSSGRARRQGPVVQSGQENPASWQIPVVR